MGRICPDSPEQNRNLSCKIDYVALARDRTKALFIELKTDALGRRQRQDDYLDLAQKLGMPALVDGVCQLFLKSVSKCKYYHLLKLLGSVELLQLPPAFHERPTVGWRGVSADIAATRISQQAPEISIIYLQPLHTAPGEIGFETFADWLGRFEDALSQKFSSSLRRWARFPAGMRDQLNSI